MRWIAKLLGLSWITGGLIAALALAGAVAGGMAWWQAGIIDRLDADLAAALRLADARGERITEILEDKRRDAEIDRMGSDDLLDLGAGFVRPAPSR